MGLNQYDLGVKTGKMVARILKGDKTATMPVEFMTKGDLIINQKVADELGIKIPAKLLDEAKTSGKVVK